MLSSHLLLLSSLFLAFPPCAVGHRTQKHSPARHRSHKPSVTGNLANRDLVDLDVGLCIRLDEDFKFDVEKSRDSSLAQFDLAADACLCIDTTASVGLLNLNVEVDIVTSVGLVLNGSAALNVAKAIEYPLLYPGFAEIYDFTYTEVCTIASLSLLNSQHDFQPGINGCCARSCNPGYVKSASGQCIPRTSNPPSCSASEMGCGGQCFDKQKYTCQSGIAVAMHKRGPIVCPSGMDLCPVGKWGKGMECVNTRSDIESCGGCIHAPADDTLFPVGEDCTAIPNVDSVACTSGRCAVRSCARGFEPARNGTACERVMPLRNAGVGAGQHQNSYGLGSFSVQR